MIGISSYGVHIPRGRLPLAAIMRGHAKDGGPERSVAGFDEDSVTMAVAAAADCLEGFERDPVDAVFFASTTSPYGEKQAAAIVAKALDLRRDVLSVDFGGSLRAGTSALRSALDAVAAGSARSVLVVAADCRMAAPRSAAERNLGDGAVAFLVGHEAPVAVVEHRHSIADEMLDVWRPDGERFLQTWEERFIVQHGYRENVLECAGELLRRAGTEAGELTRAALYGPDARSHAAVARGLGLKPKQVEDPLFGRLGNCGAAFAPMLLVAALDAVEPASLVLLAAYGDGAEAMLLRTTGALPALAARGSVGRGLERRHCVPSYDAYLGARNLAPGGFDRSAGAGIAATVHYRDRDADIGFRGAQCRRCGQLHFPAQRVCYQCAAKDDFEPARLAGRGGRVMSYTFDYFFPTPEPPLVATMIEIDGGCRVWMQMADVSPDELRCDLPVEFVFRKIHETGGKPNYFWKCTPVRTGGGHVAGASEEE
ncbi:MAG: OB-fold domain-containing protein [Candidatus Binatia bacterium]